MTVFLKLKSRAGSSRLSRPHMNLLVYQLNGKGTQRNLAQWTTATTCTQVEQHTMQWAGNHAVADTTAFQGRVLVRTAVLYRQVLALDVAHQHAQPINLYRLGLAGLQVADVHYMMKVV